MYVEQFFVNGLAHCSYLLGGSETCAIVDPARDVETYIEAARRMGLRITHVLETHLHADFVSGHLELANLTGAEIFAPASAKCRFDHVPLEEGYTLYIEDLKIEVLETPGHTPEHVSYVVTDISRGNSPCSVFTGDTLFVGDAGRPDLFPGRARELASSLYDSLHLKLMALPDHCEIYPAHGAGSLCGRAMGAKRTSTIGYERRYNSALQIDSREAFIRSLTADMPGAPDHFSRCSKINGNGPDLLEDLPSPSPLSPENFESLARSGATVLDIRPYEAFGGLHVPEALSIDLRGNFVTFAGWILPSERPILLVSENSSQALEATTWLRRVGLDDVAGYLAGGMYAWTIAGLPVKELRQMGPEDFTSLLASETSLNLVDVRAEREYDAAHIDGSINIPAPDIRSRSEELNKSLTTVTICNSGHRSSLAASLLQQRGFERVLNFAGGMLGYGAAKLSPTCPICAAPHGPRLPGREKQEDD